MNIVTRVILWILHWQVLDLHPPRNNIITSYGFTPANKYKIFSSWIYTSICKIYEMTLLILIIFGECMHKITIFGNSPTQWILIYDTTYIKCTKLALSEIRVCFSSVLSNVTRRYIYPLWMWKFTYPVNSILNVQNCHNLK